MTFYTSPPEEWDDLSKERIRSHFKGFDLSKKYSVEAASSLVQLHDTLVRNYSKSTLNEISSYVNSLTDHRNVNSWKTAMYQALANSK